MRSTWAASIFIHLLAVGSIVTLSLLSSNTKIQSEVKIDFEVIEKKVEAETPPIVAPKDPIEITQKKTLPKEQDSKPVQRVFGIDRDALSSQDVGVVVKQGNTITKEVDDLKLEGDGVLPAPRPQYLVSQMPVLIKEIKPEYPEEAKGKNVEGKVVLKVLIDSMGKVRKVEVLEDPGFGLGMAAQNAMYQYLFKPAKIGTEDVPVEIRYVVTFTLL